MLDTHYYELEKKASTYWWHTTRRNHLVKCLDQFHPRWRKESQKIVDIGCGAGDTLEHLSQLALHDSKILGLDISEHSIEICSRRGLNAIQADIEKGSVGDLQDSNVVIFLDVLEHLKNPEVILSKIYEKLKPNGLIYITVPAFSFLWSQWDVLLGHQKRYSKSEMEIIAKKSKYKILDSGYLFHLTFPLVYLRKFLSQKSETAEFPNVNPWINKLLIEYHKLEQKIRAPFGSSVYLVLKKENG